MIEYQEARRIAAMLAAVGEPTRMLVLHRLTERPHNVGELADLLGIPMVNMSHHLGVMRNAGLLEDDKEGRRVNYKFRPGVYVPGGDSPDVIGTILCGNYRVNILKEEAAAKSRAKVAKKSAG
jgi:DNA-binding transcriptional ArsR family regulator